MTGYYSCVDMHHTCAVQMSSQCIKANSCANIIPAHLEEAHILNEFISASLTCGNFCLIEPSTTAFHFLILISH